MDDAELLKDFADTGSEDSFKTLVDRHINLVYSVARHTTRDPHLAEEVAQSVFIILAKKAGKLGNVKALSAWLYRTTRLAAVQSVRNECRRREREEKFASMDHTVAEPNWEQIEPHLAEVIDQLGETDCTAIVLRFFQSRSLKDVARTLGCYHAAIGVQRLPNDRVGSVPLDHRLTAGGELSSEQAVSTTRFEYSPEPPPRQTRRDDAAFSLLVIPRV